MDGSRTAILILTFFFRYMKELVESDMYTLLPPLICEKDQRNTVGMIKKEMKQLKI